MSRFTAPLVVTPSEDYKRWAILYSGEPRETDEGGYDVQDFGYDIGEEGGRYTIIVHRFFETDFASIPWFARWLIPTWGRHTNAAVIHDYLYYNGVIIDREVRDAGFGMTGEVHPERKYADKIFLEAMEITGTPKWQRLVMYYAVRWFAGPGWRRLRKT